jgi:hypothetical protein
LKHVLRQFRPEQDLPHPDEQGQRRQSPGCQRRPDGTAQHLLGRQRRHARHQHRQHHDADQAGAEQAEPDPDAEGEHGEEEAEQDQPGLGLCEIHV